MLEYHVVGSVGNSTVSLSSALKQPASPEGGFVWRKERQTESGAELVAGNPCAMIPRWKPIALANPDDRRGAGKGYTHLRATCPKCGRIADVPWPLLLGRRGTNRETFLGNIPSRCQRGNATPIIGVR